VYGDKSFINYIAEVIFKRKYALKNKTTIRIATLDNASRIFLQFLFCIHYNFFIKISTKWRNQLFGNLKRSVEEFQMLPLFATALSLG